MCALATARRPPPLLTKPREVARTSGPAWRTAPPAARCPPVAPPTLGAALLPTGPRVTIHPPAPTGDPRPLPGLPSGPCLRRRGRPIRPHGACGSGSAAAPSGTESRTAGARGARLAPATLWRRPGRSGARRPGGGRAPELVTLLIHKQFWISVSPGRFILLNHKQLWIYFSSVCVILGW